MPENYELAEQVAAEWPQGGEQRDLSILAHQVLRQRDRVMELERVIAQALIVSREGELWSARRGNAFAASADVAEAIELIGGE